MKAESWDGNQLVGDHWTSKPLGTSSRFPYSLLSPFSLDLFFFSFPGIVGSSAVFPLHNHLTFGFYLAVLSRQAGLASFVLFFSWSPCCFRSLNLKTLFLNNGQSRRSRGLVQIRIPHSKEVIVQRLVVWNALGCLCIWLVLSSQ